ncbi:MAG: FG-GAP repeat protein, partial [Actinomycetota bacterium]
DRFGSALAGADFNMDGFADLSIGVARETVGGSAGTGAVNTLYGSAAGLQATSPADQLWHEGISGVQGEPAPGNAFGSALAA